MSGLGSELSAAEKAVPLGRRDSVFTDSNLPNWRFWTLSLGLMLGLFLSVIDSSIVATSLFTIGQEFGTMESINWVALSYTLAYLSCAVLFARMADVIGRRNAYVAAFVIFFTFSLGCGFAQTMDQLIALRTLQGIGGSGLYSLTMITWPELAKNEQKAMIGGLVGVVIAIAGVMGPVLGGVLTQFASWRWVFWINGPIGAVAMVIFLLTWPSDEYLPNIELRSWGSLDFLGSFLIIAASVLTTFSFQNAGSATNVWTTPVFLAPLIIGVICWFALLGWSMLVEHRWRTSILSAFPMSLLRNRVYVFAMLNTMCLGFPYFVMLYSFPLRLQVVNGKSALLAGVLLLPMLAGVSIGSFLGGGVNGNRNRIPEALIIASLLSVLGCALETTLSSSADLDAKSLGFLVFLGLGFGLSASSSTILTTVEASIADHAPAQGIVAQMRIFGGSIGIAASSAILAVKQQSQLVGVVPLEAMASAHGGNGAEGMHLTEAQDAAIRGAFADAFTEDMTVAAAVAGLAVLFAIGTWTKMDTRLTMGEARAKLIEEETERRRSAKGAKGEETDRSTVVSEGV